MQRLPTLRVVLPIAIVLFAPRTHAGESLPFVEPSPAASTASVPAGAEALAEMHPARRTRKIRKPLVATGVAIVGAGILTMAVLTFPPKIVFGERLSLDDSTAGKILLGAAFLGQLSGATAMTLGLAGEEVSQPVPPNMAVATVHRRNLGLTFAGGGLLAATYGLALVQTFYLAAIKNAEHCLDCEKVSRVLWIPIAGPIVADAVDSSDTLLGSAWLVTWSLAQLAGATMLAVGAYGRDVDELRPTVPPIIELNPHLSPRSAGLSLQVRF